MSDLGRHVHDNKDRHYILNNSLKPQPPVGFLNSTQNIKMTVYEKDLTSWNTFFGGTRRHGTSTG
jgi:hypothetical protein